MDAKELRRLLDLAAKAVGYATHHRMNSDRMLLSPPVVALVVHDADGRLISTCWNPAEDDGDSRRLEVALEMIVDNFTGEVRVKNGWSYGSPNFHTEDIPREDDPCAATRLAVLRAAAAIGESNE